jgi:hypothetical protein
MQSVFFGKIREVQESMGENLIYIFGGFVRVVDDIYY